jgi:hypothetical protein
MQDKKKDPNSTQTMSIQQKTSRTNFRVPDGVASADAMRGKENGIRSRWMKSAHSVFFRAVSLPLDLFHSSDQNSDERESRFVFVFCV